MCGIVGYIGRKQAVPILLAGLQRLEYRGYDSSGVAVLSGGIIEVSRSAGKLRNLDDKLGGRVREGVLGLGHTRWATHGGPSEDNAHPHRDCTGSIAVVHNGIIENYTELKRELLGRGHRFVSATDTEVLPHLMEEEVSRRRAAGETDLEGVLANALRTVLNKVRGAYALAVLWSETPGIIVAAKKDSPLVVGLGESENILASDVPALLAHTREVVYMEDGESVVLRASGCAFYDATGAEILKPATRVEWNSAAAEKNGCPHFMLKEIREQPAAVRDTLRGRLFPLGEDLLKSEAGLTQDDFRAAARVRILACGTSWHAGIFGKYLFERYAGLPAQIETAAEFRYRHPVLEPGTLVIAISQSGETADTLAAVRLAQSAGLKVLSIGNTVGSAISRQADFDFHTHCGPERGVASTKAFVGQLTALSILTLHAALARGVMSKHDGLLWVSELRRIPGLLLKCIGLDAQMRRIAEEFSDAESFLFLGRGVNYPTALEAALKLKEISYIHAEGFPAGEMKHGPLALVSPRMPVAALATGSDILEKTLSNIEEAGARGARIIALCTVGERRLDGSAEHVVYMPPVAEQFSPILNIVPLQLLAYHAAVIRGCDVDQPRNLAKSVTVE